MQRRFSELPNEADMSQFVYKVSGGPLIRVHLCIHEGRIYEVLFTGNMQPSRRAIPEELEEALRYASAEEAVVEDLLRKAWQEKEMVVGGARVEDFITAVIGAIKRIA